MEEYLVLNTVVSQIKLSLSISALKRLRQKENMGSLIEHFWVLKQIWTDWDLNDWNSLTSKKKFDSWDKSKLVAHFGNFGQSKHWSNDESKKCFDRIFSSRMSGFRNETLMEQMKPVVTEKNEFEYRDNSLLMVFWMFWTIRTSMQATKLKFVQSNTPVQVKGFRITLGSKNSNLVFGGNWVATSRKFNINRVFSHSFIVEETTERCLPAGVFE